jgi:glycine/D-amino acid oxidase-like deaminating enzyme
LTRLETKSAQFVACLSEQKGCMNSALFTERVASYLLKTYSNRFSVFEHTHINKVVLHDDCAFLDADTHTIQASRAILCTNGFDNVNIFNKSGLDIDTRFHHSIEGVIGYMSGYMDQPVKSPTAISYFTDAEGGLDSPYIYLTRRMYEYNANKHDLISIGGPEIDLENRKEYEKDHEYPEWARDEIDQFVQEYYAKGRGEKIDYIFTWHGLMGYTPHRLRIVGPEPKNQVLLYNIGCNGVGILPSIFGGERISRILRGDKLESSIFDPKTS